ncbi:coq1 putative hexaprenyl diphosphate synthase [Basidiobolus ranarum]|uniref:Coq1 putative hexaprenyl diphosphate synthase n=1 Tax=Basidiobolus ranarum TaxID=34480 RepID=A0ABR2WPN2_9FUNG
MSFHLAPKMLVTPRVLITPVALRHFRVSFSRFNSRLHAPISPSRPKPIKNHFTGKASNWTQAVLEAEALVQHESAVKINPKHLLGEDIAQITPNIRSLLNTKDSQLYNISKYYFEQPGTHVRPLLVLLMSQATRLGP